MTPCAYMTKPGRSVKWSLPLLSEITVKPCEHCGKDIVKDPSLSKSRWMDLRFCNGSCASKSAGSIQKHNETRKKGCQVSKVKTTVAELNQFKQWLVGNGYKIGKSKTIGVLFSVKKNGAYRQIRTVDDYHYGLGVGLKSLFEEFKDRSSETN